MTELADRAVTPLRTMTFVDRIRAMATRDPAAVAVRYLVPAGGPTGTDTYRTLRRGELDAQACAVAGSLSGRVSTGDRVLVVVPPGTDFLGAVLGCLYAGAVAVPLPVPTDGSAEQLVQVGRDAGVVAVLTAGEVAPRLRDAWHAAGLPAVSWVLVEDCTGDAPPLPPVGPADLALLLYTSGSTGDPKGVMVGHAELTATLELFAERTALPYGGHVVNWIPLTHALGLGMVLLALYVDGAATVLTPGDFFADPLRWLRAISDADGPVFSGGPPVGYDRCAAAVAACPGTGIRDLDLSRWAVALVGAERVRPDGLARFREVCEPYGFDGSAWFPAYGLTETMLIAAGHRDGPVVTVAADPARLDAGELVTAAPGDVALRLIGCGPAGAGANIVIVDPATRRRVEPGRVGEIWISGPVVMRGYWRRPAESDQTFGATLVDGSGPFLRTGDLAAEHAGEIVVCGRLKELIIIRGRNVFPQDVEQTCRRAHPAIGDGPIAAFSVEGDGEERLVVVASTREVRRGAQQVAEALRGAVTAAHDVEPHEVAMVRPDQLQLTASGKVKRGACRDAYLASTLRVVATAGRCAAADPAPAEHPLLGVLRAMPDELRPTVLVAELRRRLAEVAGGEPTDVGNDVSVVALGLDSMRVMELRGALHLDLGALLPLAEFSRCTVTELGDALARAMADGGPAEPAVVAVADSGGRHDRFPLTDLQHAYFVGRDPSFPLGGVSTHFFAEFDSELDPGVDPQDAVARLRQALDTMVDRHDMLRAVVEPDGTQRVLPREETGPVPLPHQALGAAPRGAVDDHLARVRAEMSHDVLELGRWPMFDIRATSLPGSRLRVHVSLDLLLFDVWSLRLFFREWGELFRDPGADLPRPGITFRDYVRAAAAEREGAEAQRAATYWTERVPTLPPGPELPFAAAPDTVGAPRFRRLQSRLDARAWQRIRDHATGLAVTPTAVLLAAYATVLAGWTRSSHFCVTIPTFNRLPLHDDIEQVIGDFTAVTLLEIDLRDGPGIGPLAQRIQNRLWQDLEHRAYSGVQVLRQLAQRSGRSSGLFAPVVFASARGQSRDGDPDLPVTWLGDWVFGVSQTPQVVLDQQVWEDDDGLLFNWDHVDGLLRDGVVDDMFAAYCAVLDDLGAAPGGPGDDAGDWSHTYRTLLPRAQRELVAAANDTAGPVPGGLLHDPLVASAQRSPERVAIVAEDATLTYGELYAAACGFAHTLRHAGLERGGIVGVCAPKGAAQIVATVGVLLAGGVYLPVDPGLPAERQDLLLRDAGASFVLGPAADGARRWPAGIGAPEIDLQAGIDLQAEIDLQAGPPVEPDRSPDDLAYVIYTSGSTGRPKGVAVSHAAALNTCVDVNDRFQVGADDVVLGLSSLSFDLSVYDVFGVLGAGGTLVLPGAGAERDPGAWLELATRHRVSVWNSVPALMSMFVEYVAAEASSVPTLRRALLSGDWIPVELAGRVRAIAPHAEVIGLGGATEAAIWSIHYRIGEADPGWDSVPYGFPLRNQTFHVLDDQLSECPVHVTGELYIGGAGLAQCYWNDAERTAASFVTHPRSGERLYRTGDLGRRMPDGAIEFLGREDTQVKVGGFRIELGEIEAVLGRHDQVRTAVVAATGERHHLQLAGWVVPQGPRDPAGDEALLAAVRAFAGEHLPAYMVPPVLAVVDELPLTGNGKVDRSRLDLPAAPVAAGVAPAGALETTILAAVRRHSGRADGDVLTNFFDLGVDSLMITKIYRDLRAELNVPFPITDMFGQPNVRRLAAHLGAPRDRVDPTSGAAQDRALARRAAMGRR